MALGSKKMNFWGDKEDVAGESSRESARWLEKGCFFPEELGMAVPWLCLAPCPLSSGFWLFDEVPGVGASCSSGNLHTGPGPSSGKGVAGQAPPNQASHEWSGSSSGRR